MKNYEIKRAFKNLPDAGLPDNEPVMCNDAKGVGPLVLAYTEMIARK